jgi:hypothetical protein
MSASSCQQKVLLKIWIFDNLIAWKYISLEFCCSWKWCWKSYTWQSFVICVVCSCLLAVLLSLWHFSSRFLKESFVLKWLNVCTHNVHCKYIFIACYSSFPNTHIFILFFLISNSLMYLEIIIVYDVRYWSNFISLEMVINLTLIFIKIF